MSLGINGKQRTEFITFIAFVSCLLRRCIITSSGSSLSAFSQEDAAGSIQEGPAGDELLCRHAAAGSCIYLPWITCLLRLCSGTLSGVIETFRWISRGRVLVAQGLKRFVLPGSSWNINCVQSLVRKSGVPASAEMILQVWFLLCFCERHICCRRTGVVLYRRDTFSTFVTME